jgi:predicted TIM-barrel fold metal-dependent hydrolase
LIASFLGKNSGRVADMSYFHYPRRQFCKKSFLFLGALGGLQGSSRGHFAGHEHSPVSSSFGPDRQSEEPRPLEKTHRDFEDTHVFDAHLHCPSESGKVWQWHPVTRDFREFAQYLARCGVNRGIINSVRSQLADTVEEFKLGNREVASYTERYQDRFLGACVVNPLFIDEALQEMEYCRRELGFVWVGELCNYTVPYEYTLKEFELLVEKAVELNMVLDVHTNLHEMEYIIEKFPQATIVFPHFGDDNEHAHIFKRIDLVARHENCYLDTSGYGHDRMGMLEYAVEAIGPDRVLFGSDFSINDPSTVIARIKNSFLTQEQKEKILAGNLQRLLKEVGA